MSKWGVYDQEDGPPHVMPCDDKGYALYDHTDDDDCWCKPVFLEADTDCHRDVIMHNDARCGGYDA